MNGLLLSTFVATWLAAGLGVMPILPGATDKLTVQALEAVAQITPHAAGERQIQAPSLSFALRVDFGCASDAAASLSFGIADTHYRHVPKDTDGAFLAVIDVSAEQIAPITTGDFCVAGSAGKQADLLLHGVATAQVALRCTSGEGTAMRITSAALPLRLECTVGVDQDAPPASE
jgi:hypothetical protein